LNTLNIIDETIILQVNDIAPEFSGTDQFGNTYRLQSFLGWKTVLLMFYPFDWNPTCSIQMLEIQRDLEKFKNAGVLVIGVSVDSNYSHQAWAEKHSIQFPLLSDFEKTICREYGVLNEKGFAERTFVLIGRDGKIKYIKLCKPGEKPSTESLLKIIKDLKSIGEL